MTLVLGNLNMEQTKVSQLDIIIQGVGQYIIWGLGTNEHISLELRPHSYKGEVTRI